MLGPSRIALTGPPAAGKSEVAAMLETEGYRLIDVGALLEQRLRAAGVVPPTRAHIGTMFVHEFGIGGVYEALRDVMPRGRPVVLDAIRAASTVQELRRHHDEMFFLHVDAPESIRASRLRQRIANWMDPPGAERAYAALNTDASWCRENANAVIWNDGSPEALRRKLGIFALAPAR